MCLKRVEKKKLLGRHNKDISLSTFAKQHRRYSIKKLLLKINKHNQKLLNILENQKIYGGFLKILIFRVSLFYLVNGSWKVKPEISVFSGNVHKSFGFPIC